jgi:serine/threonine-protein kinase
MREIHLTDEQLRRFAAGRLKTDDGDAVALHLSTCKECARRVRLVQTTDTSAVALKQAPLTPNSDSESVASTQSRRKYEEDTKGRPALFPEVLEPGTSVGRYELGEVLGAGAFATVYRGIDKKLSREVAVKVLHGAATSQDARRFFREARAAGKISHKNICPVFDMGQNEGIRYIVMGLVIGKNLREYIDSGKKITINQAVHATYKLASALLEAHRKGIVHRDLKPANIMIDSKRRELVILDFGLARQMDSRASRLTHAGDVLGTPVYMAPEQVRGDVNSIGPPADVYALGVILFELLAGRRPFVGSIAEVFAEILYQTPDPPSTFCPGLSPSLDGICLQALAKDQINRFQSMQEFREALVDFSHGKTSSLLTDTGRLKRKARSRLVTRSCGQRSPCG